MMTSFQLNLNKDAVFESMQPSQMCRGALVICTNRASVTGAAISQMAFLTFIAQDI